MAHSDFVAVPAVWERARAEVPAAGWEKGLAVAGFLVLLETFRILLLSGGPARTEGSALFQLVSGSIYLSALLILLARGIPFWAFAVLRRAWPLVGLTLLPLISVLWSQAPDASLRRAIALILTSAFAFFVVVRFNPRTIFNLLAIAFAVFVVVGILAAAIPGVGITPSGQYAGSWRGLAGQKNVFARAVALAVAVLPAAVVLGLIGRRGLTLAVSVFALGLLVLSQSATSLVSAFAGVAIGTTLYVALGGRIGGSKLRPELGITFLLIAAVTGALAVTYGWTAILEALGRDPTLTGRTKLWDWAIDANSGREWLGSGYRSFWINANTKYFFEVFAWSQGPEGRSESFAGPEHAHNGFVDTYLELGLLGVTALALMVISALAVLRRAFLSGDSKVGFIFAVILSFLLIYSITERSILQQSEDLWFLFILLYLLTIKETILERRPGIT
jgi:exopolysaccharide production protein ExoQ